MAASRTGYGTENSVEHVLAKKVVFGDIGDGDLVIGTLSNAVVVDTFCVVETVFNAGTSCVLDIGTAGDPDGFATDYDVLASVGSIARDTAIATSNDCVITTDTNIVCSLVAVGTAATTGSAWVGVKFIPMQAFKSSGVIG
jgi:hypothetical protein